MSNSPVCSRTLSYFHAFARLWDKERYIFILAFFVLLSPYLLANFSYVNRYEAEHTIPIVDYFLFQHPGGNYVHALGGGNDAAAFGIGLEGTSVYRLARSVLPLWVAMLVDKSIVLMAAFFGGFALLHRILQIPRPVAGLLSLIFLIEQIPYDSQFRYGYHLMPLMAYLCSCSWRDHRVKLAAALAFLYMAGANPVHNLPNLAFAAVFGPLMVGRFSLKRSSIAVGAISVASLINWAEPLYAWLQLAPYSNRLDKVDHTFWNLLFSQFTSELGDLWHLTGFFALVMAALLRAPRWRQAALAFAAYNLFYSLVLILPWDRWHLAFVPSVAAYASGFWDCTSVILLGIALEGALQARQNGNAIRYAAKMMTVTIIGVAVVMTARLHLGTFRTLVHDWNQSYFQNIGNLAKPTWHENGFRTVAVNGSVPIINTLAGAYGLDTFGGIINLKNSRHETYWSQIDLTKREEQWTNHGTWIAANFDYFLPDSLKFDGERMMSLRLLAIANVRYIVSESALSGSQLNKISGPSTEPQRSHFFASNRAEKLAYYRRRLALFLNYEAVNVYEIPTPFPRVYSPGEIVAVPHATSARDFIRRIEAEATTERALARPEDMPTASPMIGGKLEVKAYREVVNGIEVDIGGGPGIVAVNYPYLPFWRAEADGRSVMIVPVNEIQMAVQVPAGTKSLRFIYHRAGISALLTTLGRKLGLN